MYPIPNSYVNKLWLNRWTKFPPHFATCYREAVLTSSSKFWFHKFKLSKTIISLVFRLLFGLTLNSAYSFKQYFNNCPFYTYFFTTLSALMSLTFSLAMLQFPFNVNTSLTSYGFLIFLLVLSIYFLLN